MSNDYQVISFTENFEDDFKVLSTTVNFQNNAKWKLVVDLEDLAVKVNFYSHRPYIRDKKFPDFTEYETALADLVIGVMDLTGDKILNVGGAILAKIKCGSKPEPKCKYCCKCEGNDK